MVAVRAMPSKTGWMLSEKSSIVSFQPSRGCNCSHIVPAVVSQSGDVSGSPASRARRNDALSAYKAVGNL